MTDTTTTTTAAGAGAGAGAGGAPAAFDWNAAGLDADTATYVGAKGFKGPGDVVKSYRDLEKLLGAGPDKLLKLPGDDKPESWAPIYDKLGRPADPTKYELAKFEVPGLDEKAAEKFHGFLRQTFHGLGLTGKQAAGFTKQWSEFVGTQFKEQEAHQVQAAAAEETTLKGEWGQGFEKNVNVAKQAAAAFGLNEAKLDALEEALGFGATMKFLHSVGSKMGEATYAGGEGPGGGYGAEAAKAEITSLKADPEFGKRLVNGDSDARAKWDRLHKIAFPG